jgi:hypothetical protein
MNGHVEHVMNVLPFITNLQDGGLESFAIAGVTGDINICEELHFHLDDALTLAFLTSALRHVEREIARRELTKLG